jgi:hypothetical protein
MGGTGIDRRTIIKRGAATGALAWTAPVILDSLASPAGAITCSGACVRVQFPPRDDPLSCETTSSTVVNSCTPTSPDCSTTTNLGPGVAMSDVCMFSILCDPESPLTSFELSTTDTACFNAAGATCSAPRRLLAAQAGYRAIAGAQACVVGAITVDFARRLTDPPRTLTVGCSSSSSSAARARSLSPRGLLRLQARPTPTDVRRRHER